MERLFIFFYQYRVFFTFLVLEVACAWMIIENNQYQGARFFNSSNALVANLNNFLHGVHEYFQLRKINSTLADENAYLRSKLEQYNQLHTLVPPQSVLDSASSNKLDSAVIKQYDFISAKVVNNTVNRFTNYLTLNKGFADGIEPEMAVISPMGVVGKVKAVSKHYSVVTSILHIEVKVSAVIKRTGALGSAQWDGRDPGYVNLEFVPSHVKPQKGDTVITSGYNAVYPEGIMIGVIDEVKLEEDLFYDIKLKLSQDFRRLSYVEIVRSHLKSELDSLQAPFVVDKQQ